MINTDYSGTTTLNLFCCTCRPDPLTLLNTSLAVAGIFFSIGCLPAYFLGTAPSGVGVFGGTVGLLVIAASISSYYTSRLPSDLGSWARGEIEDLSEAYIKQHLTHRDSYGATLLMIAVWYLKEDLYDRLIAMGADVHVKDFKGENLLHRMILFPGILARTLRTPENIQAYLSLMQKIIDQGVDINGKTKAGKTPLDLFRERFHATGDGDDQIYSSIDELLVRNGAKTS